MKYLTLLLLVFFIFLNCAEEEPTAVVDELNVHYEITGTAGEVEITYLYEHSYLDSTKSIPWSVTYMEYSDNAIVYIAVQRINDDINGQPPVLTATIYINDEVYKTATVQGYNSQVKVGGWYGI